MNPVGIALGVAFLALGLLEVVMGVRFSRGTSVRLRAQYDNPQASRWLRNLPFGLIPIGLGAMGMSAVAALATAGVPGAGWIALALIVLVLPILVILGVSFVLWPPGFLKPPWLRDRERPPGA